MDGDNIRRSLELLVVLDAWLESRACSLLLLRVIALSLSVPSSSGLLSSSSSSLATKSRQLSSASDLLRFVAQLPGVLILWRMRRVGVILSAVVNGRVQVQVG